MIVVNIGFVMSYSSLVHNNLFIYLFIYLVNDGTSFHKKGEYVTGLNIYFPLTCK